MYNNNSIVSCYIGKDIGNQLFRIATVIDYGNKYNKTVLFQSDNEDVKTLWNKFFCENINIINILDMVPIEFECFTELKRDVYEEIPEFVNNVMLIGKFQSYQYMSPKTRLKMRELVYSNETYMYEAYKAYNKIKDNFGDDFDDNFVAVYVKKDSELQEDYYEDAYKRICDLENDRKHVVVFSDDIEWCKKTFRLAEDQYFAGFENKCVELIVMSMFYHNILSNSTYAWWGAYLSNHNEKVVVVPKQWKSNNYTMDGMIFHGWNVV